LFFQKCIVFQLKKNISRKKVLRNILYNKYIYIGKFIKSNITSLTRLKRSQISDDTTRATQKRTDEIMQLYTDRKISNVATAENLIKGLTSPKKKIYDNTFQKYKDNIRSSRKQNPLKERMAESKKKKKPKKT
jgi:hypothetical protein